MAENIVLKMGCDCNMPFDLMYITNNPLIAKVAIDANINTIFVDMEYIGKETRQKNMDSVKNHHTFEDIIAIKSVINKSKVDANLLVRVNPIHENSQTEINTAIQCGADIIMLPMWKSIAEVEKFISFVNKKAKSYLLLETKEAVSIIDEIIKLKNIDGIYIGLNDLHLSYNYSFMFEPLSNGLIDYLSSKITSAGIKFGFGGLARIGEGTLPAEKILAEHIRLQSSMVILSRSFCNCQIVEDLKEIQNCFEKGVSEINKAYISFCNEDNAFFEENRKKVKYIVDEIVEKRGVEIVC